MLSQHDATALMRLAEQDKELRENGGTMQVDDPVITALIRALVERAQYLDEAGLDYLIFRLKTLYVQQEPGKGLSTNDFTDEYKNRLENSISADQLEELNNKIANSASKTELQNVKNDLLNVINSIQGISYLVVSELPSRGENGVIYLLRLTEFVTTKNLYEEYIWVQDRYELLGSVEVGGAQEGPFITDDILKDTLKAYVQKIKVGTDTFIPDTAGIVDLTNAIKAIAGMGTVKEIVVNKAIHTPNANGRVTLTNVVGAVSVDGTTINPDDLGNVDISLSNKYLPLTGGTMSGNIRMALQSSGTSITMPTIMFGNGSSAASIFGGSGEVTIDTPSSNVQFTSGARVPSVSISGLSGSNFLVTRVKVNGSTKTTDYTGLIDLGTISSSGDYLPLSGGTLTGDLRIKGSSNFGTKINLGDGDYVHISEPTDDVMDIKATTIQLSSTNVPRWIKSSTTQYLIASIKLNGTTYEANTNGLVDLGTISSSSGNYLPISGGTLTGDLCINDGSSNGAGSISIGEGATCFISEYAADSMMIFATNGVTIQGKSVSIVNDGAKVGTIKTNGDLRSMPVTFEMNDSVISASTTGLVDLGTIITGVGCSSRASKITSDTGSTTTSGKSCSRKLPIVPVLAARSYSLPYNTSSGSTSTSSITNPRVFFYFAGNTTVTPSIVSSRVSDMYSGTLVTGDVCVVIKRATAASVESTLYTYVYNGSTWN